VVMVNPGGTERPMLAISARFAPFPPSCHNMCPEFFYYGCLWMETMKFPAPQRLQALFNISLSSKHSGMMDKHVPGISFPCFLDSVPFQKCKPSAI
jgi:hypothetical protein